jgi:hypothetical protein
MTEGALLVLVGLWAIKLPKLIGADVFISYSILTASF